MRALPTVAVSLVISALAAAAQQGAPSSNESGLDYSYFKTKVQPIFLAKRDGHARCVSCHVSGTPLRLQPLSSTMTWSEDDTRKNFEAVRRVVVPGSVAKSRLLVHPLDESAGGDFYHSGGKHWTSQHDVEWQTLKAWVVGDAATGGPGAPPSKVRIIQTNSAGDNVHLIDPVTNTVAGVITGIEVGHGAGAAPDGRRIYVSDEATSSLAVVDSK